MSDGGLDGIRARLIAAAGLEIRQIGPRRMSVSGVAGRLGMSHANVYHYFDDKAALVEAVLNGWLRPLEQRLQEIVDGPDPADDKLERFLTTLSRAYGEGLRLEPAIFRLLGDGASEREAKRHRKRLDDWMERIAEEGIATRIFAAPDARRAAQLVVDLTASFCDAMVMLARWGEQLSDPRRDRAIRAAVRALSHR